MVVLVRSYVSLGPLRPSQAVVDTRLRQRVRRLVKRWAVGLVGGLVGATLGLHDPTWMTWTAASNGYAGSVDVAPLLHYIHYIITVIRVMTAAFIALILTYLGFQQALSLEGNAVTEIKKYLKNAVWALCLVFFGSELANVFIGHIYQ